MALADQLIGVLSVFTDLKNRDTYRILSYSIKSSRAHNDPHNFL